MSQSLPVFRNVDILVIGSSTAAVAAALEVKKSGRSVALVSDLSYLGEDLAGTLSLWPASIRLDDPLLAAAYRHCEVGAARPAALKGALETALLAQEIFFQYLTRPVAVLRDASGRISGAVMATRTSLYAITCSGIIDATRHGLVARLAGVGLRSRAEVPRDVHWNILASKVPAGWKGNVEPLLPAYRHQHKEELREYPAFRLSLDRASLGSDPAAAEHVARSLLVDDSVRITADLLLAPPAEVWDTTVNPGTNPATLDDGQFSPGRGLWLASGMLPVSDQAAPEFTRPDVLTAVGRRAGALAASSIASPGSNGAMTVHTGGNQAGDFHFTEAFLRRTEGSIETGAFAFPAMGDFDVVVAGGGTGGAPAGIAAAREGARTLVIEMQHGLGGVGTVGLISSYYFGNKVGFTAELIESMVRHDSVSRSKKGNSWSPEVKIAMYHRMLQAAGGRAWMGSYAFGVRMEGSRVAGLLVSTPFGSGLVNAGCVVDASGNADIAAAAGAPCRVMDARHVATQGTGLSPRPHPEAHYQNSDHTFIDENDPAGITHAHVHARRKYPADFDTTAIVDSRERRQIIGEVEISPLDLLAERTFPDTVFTAMSNFDTHGFTIHPVFMVVAPDHKPLQAHVPYRCMLPRGVEGVLVTGLGMSAHRDALPVIRMQADVQNQGYAAGMAAAESARTGVPPAGLDIRKLQARLVEKGVIAPEVATHGDSFPLDDAHIRQAAQADLGKLLNIATLFAHPEQSLGPLLDVLHHDPDTLRRENAAMTLGLMGCAEAAPFLLGKVRGLAWDEGWNYRGMGQFGLSMSRLDGFIVALAKTGHPEAAAVILEKINTLEAGADFSHCRAVSLACAMLDDARLPLAIATLLGKPGMTGHAELCQAEVLDRANGDSTETESRNVALRELHLARGLYLAGDHEGLGRGILQSYTGDLRGHFARHARALLSHPNPDELRSGVA